MHYCFFSDVQFVFFQDSCTSQTSTETAVTQDEPQFPIAMATQETEEEEEEEDDEVSSLSSSSSRRDEDGLSSVTTEDNESKQEGLQQDQEEEEEEEALGKVNGLTLYGNQRIQE